MAQGISKPQRISTNALELEIASLSDASGATGWAYYDSGHLFYVLSFRAAKRTIVYDVATNLWHDRSTRDWATGIDYAWEPQYAISAYNDIYFGATNSNRLLKLSNTRYKDFNDNPIVRWRTSPIYSASDMPISIREFMVDMEAGTTPLLEGIGRDPQVQLHVSTDGGSTFKAMDVRSYGKQGEYAQEVKWSNIGAGTKMAVKLIFSDSSPVIIYGAKLAIQKGSRR